MLEYELNTQYLEHADILKDTTFFQDIKSNQENINLANSELELEIYISRKDEDTIICRGVGIASFVFFIFSIFFLLTHYSGYSIGDIIIGSFLSLALTVSGLLFGAVLSMSFISFKEKRKKTSSKYKQLTQLVENLESEKIVNYNHLREYLSKKENQHQVLKQVSDYYEVIVQQCGLEFAETLGYQAIRQELVNSFIKQQYPNAIDIIKKINALIQSVPFHYQEWTQARNYTHDYQQFLKTENTLDAFEDNEAIHLKRMI